MKRFFPVFTASMLLAAIVAPHALAETKAETPAEVYDARRDRIEGLDKTDLGRIDELLNRGPVGLVEFADVDADQLPAINIAVRVRASARMLQNVVENPSDYARFMPALDKVVVKDRQKNVIVYDWSFNLALLRLSGRNVMTVYPAPADHPEATSRVTIDSESGDLGRGRFVFRIVPEGPSSSVLVLSMRLDLREANYVARQLAKAARSVNRSANTALAVSMTLHLQKEAEHRAGAKASGAPAPAGLIRPDVNAATLAPLLERGDVVLFGMRDDELDQIGVVGVINQKAKKVTTALHDARAFGSALVPGSAAKIVSEEPGSTVFDWNIALPLIGLSGRMRMNEEPSMVSIDATGGAMQGGRWCFELKALSKQTTLVTGWARFNFKDTTWLLEKMVSADPFIGHGMSAASEVMLMRALRNRATDP